MSNPMFASFLSTFFHDIMFKENADMYSCVLKTISSCISEHKKFKEEEKGKEKEIKEEKIFFFRIGLL